MSQQRRDDVSAKLGSLLLKGYKMLADSCPKCSNVLMQDKKGVITCVNCTEEGRAEDKVVVSGLAHKLPDRGYSDGIPYRSQEGTPEAACYAEEVLLREIKNVAQYLEKRSLQLDFEDNSQILQHRTVHLEYIRQCAETIKVLHSLNSTKCCSRQCSE